jgi:ribonuclease P protein component
MNTVYNRKCNEKNISTKQSKEKTNARLQNPHEHRGGQANLGQQAAKKASEANSLGAAVHKEMRLKPSALFKKVYERGASRATGELALFSLAVGDKSQTRVGFSVSKKVGNAVTRNKIRRRLRSVIESKAERLKDGYLLVLVGRPKAATSSFEDLSRSVEKLLGRADLLKDKHHEGSS